mmetsp:Transcript_50165/g.115084  ORF Transcript_50165/g.115084 Transcript_50165/m.115084 type:complete len:227 (-) Transcript_50165:399-1079(-)
MSTAAACRTVNRRCSSASDALSSGERGARFLPAGPTDGSTLEIRAAAEESAVFFLTAGLLTSSSAFCTCKIVVSSSTSAISGRASRSRRAASPPDLRSVSAAPAWLARLRTPAIAYGRTSADWACATASLSKTTKRPSALISARMSSTCPLMHARLASTDSASTADLAAKPSPSLRSLSMIRTIVHATDERSHSSSARAASLEPAGRRLMTKARSKRARPLMLSVR